MDFQGIQRPSANDTDDDLIAMQNAFLAANGLNGKGGAGGSAATVHRNKPETGASRAAAPKKPPPPPMLSGVQEKKVRWLAAGCWLLVASYCGAPRQLFCVRACNGRSERGN